MDSKIVTIEGEDVDFLRKLPGTFEYKPMKEDENGNKVPNTESPLHGKKYIRFAYNDKVFTVNTEDEFVALYDSSRLWKVRFSINEADQYTLVKGISIERTIATTKTNAIIKKYREAETVDTNEDLLAELGATSKGD